MKVIFKTNFFSGNKFGTNFIQNKINSIIPEYNNLDRKNVLRMNFFFLIL